MSNHFRKMKAKNIFTYNITYGALMWLPQIDVVVGLLRIDVVGLPRIDVVELPRVDVIDRLIAFR